MLILKNVEILGLHPTLNEIMREFFLTEIPLVITSARRTEAEDKKLQGSGLHPEGRAIDLRLLYPLERSKNLVETLNRLWVYDPSRPDLNVAILEDDHMHIQVHPKTLRRI